MRVATKVMAAVLLVAALGVPMVETWRVLLLAAGLLAVIFNETDPRGWRRVAAALAITVAVIGAKSVLPRANIAEGHNAFLVYNSKDVLEQLPQQVYASWQSQFDALYPASDPPRPGAFSRADSLPPTQLYAWSADSVWRPAKYSRQVDEISFTSLAEFRGGFANEGVRGPAGEYFLLHNFYAGRLRRETIPFYVMYELTPATAGSRLRWKGQVFWEQAGGRFEEIVHPEVAARVITSEDAGRRVYAAFFPTPGPLSSDVPQHEHYFKLELSRMLQWSAWASAVLTSVAWFSILSLTIRVRWRQCATALGIFGAAYAFMAAFTAISLGKFLGRDYTPLGGGDDGVVFEMYGRTSAMLLTRGEILDALKSGEPIYWFQPGLRYFRMIEKIIFGDTHHLYALAVACIPLLFFFLIRHFTTVRWAWLATGVFITLVVGNFSFLQYVRIAKLGYGESAGVVFFLLGLLLLLRAEPRWGGGDPTLRGVWLAGFSLAFAMFIRPNLVLSVAALFAAYAWTSLRRKDVASIVALSAGLTFTVVMPLHNWYFGGEYILMSKTGESSVSMAFGPSDYVAALRDLVTGKFGQGSSLARVVAQLNGWLFDVAPAVHPRLVTITQLLHPLKLLALVVTLWTAVRAVRRRPARHAGLAIMSVAALLSLAPLLFSRYLLFRYTILGWDLCLMVTIVWLVQSARFNQVIDRCLRPLQARARVSPPEPVNRVQPLA